MHERLREGLTGILQIVLAFVTGKGVAGDLLLADAFVRRPALRPVGDRGPGVVEPVVRDVVSVLVRHDLFDGAPGRVLADRDDVAGRRVVAAVDLLAAADVGLPAASAAVVTSSRARPLRPCGADMPLVLGVAGGVLDGPNEGLAQEPTRL